MDIIGLILVAAGGLAMWWFAENLMAPRPTCQYCGAKDAITGPTGWCSRRWCRFCNREF